MTCKDCIHYPVCSMSNNLEYICEQSIRDDCEYFMKADNTVEVVRCKDCKYWANHKGCHPYEHLRKCYRQYCAATSENDYCSLGEKGERLYD